MPSPWPDLTVPYAHSWTEIHKGVDAQGPYYKVQYYIEQPWSVADQVVNELLGFAQLSGTKINQRAPHQYPLDPTGRTLCFQADVVGVGDAIPNSDGYPQYDTGFFVDALYRVPPIPMWPQNDPQNLQGIDPATPLLFCSQDLDFESDCIVLEKSQYKLASDATRSPVPIRIETGVTVMQLTFHRVPYMPTSLIRSLRGKVNNGTFLGAPTGCVLFKGARTHKEINADGSFVRSVQTIFHERTQPWNQVFRPDTMAWDTLQDGSGNGPYTAADLSGLMALGTSYTVGG